MYGERTGSGQRSYENGAELGSDELCGCLGWAEVMAALSVHVMLRVPECGGRRVESLPRPCWASGIQALSCS